MKLTIETIMLIAIAYLAIENIWLWKRNKKLSGDVKFWRDLSFQNKPDLSKPEYKN